MNNNYCSAPWTSRFVHTDGTITPCCFIRKIDINSLKQSFDLNQKHTACEYCWHLEEKSLHSPRYDFLHQNAHGKEVTSLSINLGNYCNAECIMCNGNTSSSRNNWARQYNKKEFKLHTIQVAETVDISVYPNLEIISLIGGEPAIHPSTIKILDDIISIGKHKELTISLNTNASRLDDKLIERLIQFKEILVTLSIDGAGDSFEYQRRPLKWSKVKPIAEQWMTVSQSIIINYVVSAVSIWGFNEFVEWMNAWDSNVIEKNPQIMITPVTEAQLSLAVLDNHQRKSWIDCAVNHSIKQDMIDILNSTPYCPATLARFKEQIVKEDQTASKKFAEIFPDWKL